MKKLKRLLSLLTALTITASAFASLAIPASADDPDKTEIVVERDGSWKIVSDTAQTVKLIRATYDGTKLATVTTSDVTLVVGENVQSAQLKEGEKLMLWKAIEAESEEEEANPDNLVPVCEAVTAPSEFIVGTVYINEPFDYDDGEIIKSAGNDVDNAYDPVTKGSIVYAAGRRANGPMNCNAKIASKELVVTSDGYADNSRGIIFTFDESAEIPTVSDLTADESLELSMKIKATKNFTVTGYGEITTDDLTTTTDYVKLRLILDKKNNKQYMIVRDTKGNLLNSKVADLSATTFEGLNLRTNNSTFNIDDVILTKHDTNTGIINVAVTDISKEAAEGAALPTTTIKVGSTTFTTGTDGTVAIAVPDGVYEVEASKSGYEHTPERSDNDKVSVTIAGDSQPVALSLGIKIYQKEPTTVTIGKGQVFIATPKETDTASTAAFTVEVLDQYGIEMASEEYTTEWAIYPTGTETANANVSISAGGVVTVAKGFTAASDSGVDAYDVTVTTVAQNEGLRGMSQKKTLYIGNMDVIYYEPIGWDIAGAGDDKTNRLASINLVSEVALPDMFEINVNMAMKGLGSDANSVSSFGFVTDSSSPLMGIQYSKTEDENIKAWTQWGSTDMNGSASLNGFSSSGVLVKSYTAGTKMNLSFVVDKTKHSVTVSDGTTSVPLTLAEDANPTKLTGLKTGHYRYYAGVEVEDITVKQPDTNYLGISGVTEVAKISGATVTRDYTLSQSVIVPDETFTWTVEDSEGTANPTGVSIVDGTLSITDTAVPGTYTIKAVSADNENKKAEFEVTIDDFQTFTLDKAEISGPHAYQLGTDITGTYKVEKLVDSIGDDVADLVPTPVWASSNASVATIDASTGVLTVVGAGTTNITATINNGTKADGETAATSVLTIPVTVGAYYVTSNTVGSTVDISSLITSDKITGYQVTVADADGKQLAKEVVQRDGSTVAVPTYTGTAASVEVAPVFTYDLGNPGTLGVLGEGKDIPVPADRYNFNVKASGDRADVYVNKQMLVNNILQGSSAVDNLDVNDIEVAEGNAKITITDCPSSASVIIKVVKSPSNVTRKQKVYALGDSLVCIYYNGGNATNNLYQTGWGQVLHSYVKDDVEVVDLGNSGVTGEGLAATAITQVAHSAKEGDIVLIECGYNDRSYSTQDKMKAALASMQEKAEAKGADVIFVSPNASHHDYNANVSWTGTMESYVTEAEAKYIDLSQKSYDFLFSRYGTDFASGSAVNDLSKIYNVSDRLHSTFNGANVWASIVAGGLIDNGYDSIVNTEYTYTFTDGLGATITCQATATPAGE